MRPEMSSNESTFNAEIKVTDWRSAAAVLGLIRYFDYLQLPYNKDELFSKGPEQEWDTLRFNSEDVTESRFLEFVEYYYSEELHHVAIQRMLYKQEYTEDEIVEINKRMAGNTILKKVFGKLKFNGSNQQEVLDSIEKNRIDIIRETFRNKKNLYANFCNPNQLFKDEQSYCRLNGYYIDGPKKGKSAAYQFSPATYVANDSRYYDFIVFAFTIGRESYFINDNCSISQLVMTNDRLKQFARENKKENGSTDVRRVMFESIIETADFIDFDVEVIKKNIDNGYFETLFLRKESIRILQEIKNYSCFCFFYKVTDKYYIDVQKEVTDSIVNLTLLDQWIEFFIKEQQKENNQFSYLVSRLIELNIVIRRAVKKGDYEVQLLQSKEVDEMKQNMKVACACAGQVVREFEKRKQLNKIASYRNKLISAIVFKDYDRFCDVLIQLAQYSGIQMNFAFDLFEDFEANKELAYSFVNALVPSRKKEEQSVKGE